MFISLNDLLFNPRVLSRGRPPLWDKAANRYALSPESETLLERIGISSEPGAGGVVVRIGPKDRDRLIKGGEGKELAQALSNALKAWEKTTYTWHLAGDRQLELGGLPRTMGILNVTPDSFSDGGRYDSLKTAVAHARKMVEAGAEIIDVGGESTRPGAAAVDAKEELARTLPVIKEVVESTGVLVSIDTTKAEVAERALEAGAAIINDISGLTFDKEMAPLAARTGAGLVIMHLRGTPESMQDNPHYGDALAEISLELRERLFTAQSAGVAPEQIVLDPGIGFAKRLEDNLAILAGLPELRSLGFPLLLGCSRKSFLGTLTGQPVDDRLLETAVTTTVAADAGVALIRIHDVPENQRVLKVAAATLAARRV